MKSAIAALSLAAALPLAANAASPAATQSWVRNYVATNTANIAARGFDTSPVSATVTNELGEAETITLTFGDARNAAMVVEESTVAGMTNGTLFARVGECAYRNTANSACTDFSGANEQFGSVLTGGRYVVTTNGAEIATNAVYSATNEVWMVRYVAHIGTNAFQSVKIRPGVHLFRSETTDATFLMRECLVTDATRARLVTPRVSFLSRLMSLLVPTAYAATYGEKIPDHDEKDGNLVRHWWTRHLYTDDKEAKHIVVDKVEITSANGQTMTYELDVVLLDIPKGVDFCQLGSYSTVPTDEQISAAVEAAVGRNRAIQLGRSEEWHEHIAAKLEQVDAIVAEIAAVKCPETGYDDEEIPPEVEPPEEHVCKFFDGHCGAWMCVECHKWYESVEDDPAHPAEHSFELTAEGGACQICTVCGSRPSDPSLHGGWHDANANPLKVVGTDHGCRCDCGKVTLFHEKGETIRYDADTSDPLVCLEVWKCARCGEIVDSGRMFDTGLTVTRTAHDETTNGKFTAVTVPNPLGEEYDDIEVCRLSYTCEHLNGSGESLGCHAARTEDLFHVIAWDDGVVSSQGDDENHAIKMPCVNGFVKWSDDFSAWRRDNPNWCGKCEVTNKPHKIESRVFEWDDPLYPATDTAHTVVKFCGNIATMRHDGVTTCGRIWTTNEAHAVTRVSYGDANGATHAISNTCGKCFGTFLAGRESHVAARDDFCNYLSELDHTVSNYCGRCFEFYPVGDGVAPHVETDWHKYEFRSQEYHAVSNYCADCHDWYYGGIEHHDPRFGMPTAYVPFGSWTHTESNECRNCGEDYVQRLVVPCKADLNSWVLRDDESSDTVQCEFCTNVCEVGHAWIPDGDTGHHCSNGVGHKWEPHDFTGGDPDVCRKCGWNIETHVRDEEWVSEIVVCPICLFVPDVLKCRALYVGGTFRSSDCAHWDRVARRCGCEQCNNNLAWCACFTQTVATAGLHYDNYNNDTMTADVGAFNTDNRDFYEDAEIPVNRSSTQTFDGNVKIASKVYWDGTQHFDGNYENENSAYTVTGVGRGGQSWTWGPTTITAPDTLTHVDTCGIAYLNGLKDVHLPGVTNCADFALYSCMSLTNVYMPKAKTFGDYAIGDNNKLVEVNLPEAVSFGNYAFYGSRKLETVRLPSVTYMKYGIFQYHSGTPVHLYLAQTNVTVMSWGVPPAAIHFPKSKTLNGVSYPAETIELGGATVPLVWEDD